MAKPDSGAAGASPFAVVGGAVAPPSAGGVDPSGAAVDGVAAWPSLSSPRTMAWAATAPAISTTPTMRRNTSRRRSCRGGGVSRGRYRSLTGRSYSGPARGAGTPRVS